MTTTNTYTDTKSVDYLSTIKKNQLESRNLKSSSSNFDMTYMLSRKSEIEVDTDVSVTAKTLGDYEVIDSSSKLVCHLPLNYDVRDASNSNHGTITGTETYVAGPEISSTHSLRRAFSFNGSTKITLANESNFDFENNQAVSFSFWFNTTQTTPGAIYVKANYASPYEGIWIYINYPSSGQFEIEIYGTGASNNLLKNTDSAYNDGLWHHCVITKSTSLSGSGVKFYIDGALVSSTTRSDTLANSILNNASPMLGEDQGYTQWYTGSLDDFQVWNVELTSGDVTELYSGKIPNKTTVTKPAILSFSDVT